MPNHYRICRAKTYSPAKFHYVDIALIRLFIGTDFFLMLYTYIFYCILHDNYINAFLKQEENGSLYDNFKNIF